MWLQKCGYHPCSRSSGPQDLVYVACDAKLQTFVQNPPTRLASIAFKVSIHPCNLENSLRWLIVTRSSHHYDIAMHCRYRGPVKEIRKALQKRATVFLIDEYRTSQTCPKAINDKYCDGQLKPATVADEFGFPHNPWTVKQCQNPSCGQVRNIISHHLSRLLKQDRWLNLLSHTGRQGRQWLLIDM